MLRDLLSSDLSMPLWAAEWFRVVNAMLAGLICGLCFLRSDYERTGEDRYRVARIVGLGVICLAVVFGSFVNLHNAFNIRVLMITVGMSLALYGMANTSKGEQ